MNKKQATRHSLTHASSVAVSSGALSLLCSPLLPFSSRPLMNMRHHFPKKARLPVDPFFRFFHHPSSLSVPPPSPSSSSSSCLVQKIMRLSLLPILVLLLSQQAVNAQPPLQGQSRFVSQNCLPVRIKSLVVFGDSFSDTGNVLKLSKHTWPLPAFFPGGRFSGGSVWADYVCPIRSLRRLRWDYNGEWQQYETKGTM